MYNYPNNHSSSNNHQCQIDCSNHNIVIENLALKSKDLYYFWQNYQWLYNKYYTIVNRQQQSKLSLQSLQTLTKQLQRQILHYRAQNQQLKLQNQRIKKQISIITINLQQDYKRQINRLNNKCHQYQCIRQQQHQQISKLNNQIIYWKKQAQNRLSQNQIQTQKHNSIVSTLHKTIDDLQHTFKKLPQQPIHVINNNQQINHIKEKHRIETEQLIKRIINLQQRQINLNKIIGVIVDQYQKCGIQLTQLVVRSSHEIISRSRQQTIIGR